MYRKFAVVIMTLVSFGALAGVKVTSLDLQTQGKNGLFKIVLDGRSNDLPDLKVLGNTIEITLGNSSAFPAITKTIRGANLSANNLAGKAMVKATLPYAVDASQVDIGFKGSNIEVYFPRGTVTATVQKVSAPTANKAAEALAPAPAKKEASVKKEDLNEDYLSKLMNEDKNKNAPAAVVKDEIKVAAAAPERAEVKTASSDAFPLVGYAVKFTVFLALVLGVFYGAVQFLKKGVFNKGKLGFLNNSKMIEVLSTTYIAPKKSLMIVKAHKQLFLVANSENGIQFLSEMKDTSGIIKEGEKEITGTNFDINMLNAEVNGEASVTLKENIHVSTPVNDETPLAKIAKATDVVKFSEELKKKAKKLKPIEFN